MVNIPKSIPAERGIAQRATEVKILLDAKIAILQSRIKLAGDDYLDAQSKVGNFDNQQYMEHTMTAVSPALANIVHRQICVQNLRTFEVLKDAITAVPIPKEKQPATIPAMEVSTSTAEVMKQLAALTLQVAKLSKQNAPSRNKKSDQKNGSGPGTDSTTRGKSKPQESRGRSTSRHSARSAATQKKRSSSPQTSPQTSTRRSKSQASRDGRDSGKQNQHNNNQTKNKGKKTKDKTKN